jgi:hypothetical protein
MTLPTNDGFSNRELSIEELEAIAAGGWLGDVWNFVKHEVGVILPIVTWVVQHWPPGTNTVNNVKAR